MTVSQANYAVAAHRYTVALQFQAFNKLRLIFGVFVVFQEPEAALTSSKRRRLGADWTRAMRRSPTETGRREMFTSAYVGTDRFGCGSVAITPR